MSSPFKLSAKAAVELKKLREALAVPEHFGLRLALKQEGNAERKLFRLGFDEKKERDLEYDIDGIRFLLDSAQSMHLLGARIDFEERGQEKGFTIQV